MFTQENYFYSRRTCISRNSVLHLIGPNHDFSCKRFYLFLLLLFLFWWINFHCLFSCGFSLYFSWFSRFWLRFGLNDKVTTIMPIKIPKILPSLQVVQIIQLWLLYILPKQRPSYQHHQKHQQLYQACLSRPNSKCLNKCSYHGHHLLDHHAHDLIFK